VGNTDGGYGLVGTSRTGSGVFGTTKGEPAFRVGGKPTVAAPGVIGVSTNGTGVYGMSQLAGQPIGEFIFSDGGIGVAGENNLQNGIWRGW
jgi:hypothetical protein